MPIQRPIITADELLEVDIDELLRLVEEQDAARNLRRSRPWTYDIIRVLWGSRSSIRAAVLYRELWHLRQPSGLPMPKKFPETVRAYLNAHTSQSSVWVKNGSKQGDDLFYSPEGKRSGTWAVHRDRAVTWLNARKLGPI